MNTADVSNVRKVKTAVVGCGMISDIYIRNLSRLLSITDLVAVCDANPAAAISKAETYGISKIMTSDELAADPEIELVVNLTGPAVHYSVLKQMLEAGKNVYTEKMFTTELDKSRELVDLADRKGLYIAVAPDTVLGAGIQTARNVIDSGLIGDVTSGFVSVSRSHILNSEMFRFLQGSGGALPYDVGIYYIGALIALLGSVKSVRGYGAPALLHHKQLLFQEQKNDSWTIPGNNIVAAALEFERGTLVSLHFNGNTVGNEQSRFELYGTKGFIQLGDPNTFNGFVKLNLPENPECDFPLTHGFNGKNMLEPAPFDHYGHRGIGVAEEAYAIRLGRPNRLSGNYGLHCQEVLYGIDKAAGTGESYELQSRCEVKPLVSGYYSTMFNGGARADAELSLVD